MSATKVYELSYEDIHGNPVALSDFANQPLLIVNTASKCGLTPQYEGLQKLHEDFSPRGLVVIGFPCNQFAGQEPGDEAAVEEFCSLNYGVTFRLSRKIDVNGSNTHPVFKFLKSKTGGLLGSAIKWNFTKFLVSPDGAIKRYAPTDSPDSIRGDIEALLK